MRRALFLIALAPLAACAGTYPNAVAEQGGKPTSLYFIGAPAEASVAVDGVASGQAASFDGKKAVLVVPPGSHRVVVSLGGAVLYDQPVYAGAGDRTPIRIR